MRGQKALHINEYFFDYSINLKLHSKNTVCNVRKNTEDYLLFPKLSKTIS
jgi:hypothetical protein